MIILDLLFSAQSVVLLNLLISFVLQARRLLVSSFSSESALTDTFIEDPKRKKTK